MATAVMDDPIDDGNIANQFRSTVLPTRDMATMDDPIDDSRTTDQFCSVFIPTRDIATMDDPIDDSNIPDQFCSVVLPGCNMATTSVDPTDDDLDTATFWQRMDQYHDEHLNPRTWCFY